MIPQHLPVFLALLCIVLTVSSMMFIALAFDRQMLGGRYFKPASEARAARLLEDWLSPAQRLSYQSHKYFDVIGCDTGTSYRIHQGMQANIEQLDAYGNAVCRWCFAPRGDVMLAQKIALETGERSAIRIANRLTVGHGAERRPELRTGSVG